MEIFISWSGARSKAMAEALKGWLPMIINAAQPWLSSSDIERGARWASDVAARLQSAKFGIICLTPSNLAAEWILFEAGALSKTVQNTHVCPLLIDLEPGDVRGPLGQFQATKVTKDEIRRLVETINAALGVEAIPPQQLSEAFGALWNLLEEKIKHLPLEDAPRPQRDPGELLEEIRGLVWTLVHRPVLPFAFSGDVAPAGYGSPEPVIDGFTNVDAARSKRIQRKLLSILPPGYDVGVRTRQREREYEISIRGDQGQQAQIVVPFTMSSDEAVQLAKAEIERSSTHTTD